jgi:DNA-binding NarL/FixJ family response regulator
VVFKEILAMKSTRVILANEPRLLREMLRRALARAPGLEIVDEVADPVRLLPSVENSKARWVVVSLWPAERLPVALDTLLVENPMTCLLGMAPDGSRARIKCAGQAELNLPGLSLDQLIAVLCSSGTQHPPEFDVSSRTEATASEAG